VLSQAVGRPKVLVVEDDAGIAEAVVHALERDGISAEAAGTIAAARETPVQADLVVLDLGLPDGSGYSLLAEWRARAGGPSVIVLTSRSDEVDCVASLEAGADDFVPKPFSPRALVARVRAVLRRRESTPMPTPPPAGHDPALVVDRERRTASYGNRELGLTKIELDLLAALALAPGRVHTRGQLVQQVWGDGYALTERTVDSHIKGLRRKLEDAGAAPSMIVAVRGVGFKIREVS